MLISDSCVDFNDQVFGTAQIERIPFKITIDQYELIDKNLDKSMLLSKMKETKNKILTSCPSPNDFLEAFQKNNENFVVTISSKLSGSYNSAMTAKELLTQNNPDSFVYIFDSKTASAGESLVALKVKELLEENLSPSQTIQKVNEYISQLKTLFILNSLDNLAKNGRIKNYQALIGSLLNIVPIMCANDDGEIIAKEKVRGRKKAFSRLVDLIGESSVDFKNTLLAITHVNAPEKAQELKEVIKSKYPFKEIIVFEASGLSSVYADNGGIIIAF
ncbi:MAG: DegV family protein [Clostridiaceae bacterium]